jgi:hypothetical protein
MQILNVGAGRSDAEYKADAESRRAELVADSRSAADTFFWAAGLAALGTGLLPIRLNLFVGIGAIDLLRFYGVGLGALYPFVLYGAAAGWVLWLIAFGFAGRKGYRWAFLGGLILYAADMMTLVITFSIWAFGIHSFFIYRWWQGQKALKDLEEMQVPSPEIGSAATAG